MTFTIDEGPLYHFGDIRVVCNVPGLDPEKLRRLPPAHAGAVFDGGALDKTTDILAVELAKLGYPFAQAVARPMRDAAAQRIDVSFVIDQGPRTYVERIDIHGNTRTRGYVIRREFDIAEGDAYNKALIDRAERRLKNLNYFKTVKISSKPGSVKDRVVLDVEVAEQSTGDFTISGGYSTTDGVLAEVKVGDRNFLGSGKAVSTSVTYGQYARGLDLSASEPYFLGTRVSAGVDIYYRQSDATSYQSYGSNIYGATMQFGTPITEQLGVQYRYSIYNQNLTLDPTSLAAAPSLPIQLAALAGPAWVSAVGSTATYSTLDNTKNPTSGIRSQLRQDLAGLGGDVKFLRTSEECATTSRSTAISSAWFAPRAVTSPAGAARRCRCSTASSAARPWCGDLLPTGSARAISPPARPWTTSAAACTGRPRRNCRAGFPAYPTSTVSRQSPSSMPAASFTTQGRRRFRVPHNRCRSPTTTSYAPRSARA